MFSVGFFLFVYDDEWGVKVLKSESEGAHDAEDISV